MPAEQLALIAHVPGAEMKGLVISGASKRGSLYRYTKLADCSGTAVQLVEV